MRWSAFGCVISLQSPVTWSCRSMCICWSMSHGAGFYPEPFRLSSCLSRCAAAKDLFGRRIITISTSHRTRNSWRSCATFIAIPGVPSARTWCAGVEAGQARPRYQARGVDLVKLSPLSNGYARYRGDRIGMDCLQQGPGTARVDARQAARFPFPGPQKLGILRLRSGRAPST